ncbi:MAG: hypothetical protein Hens3KO_15110 [Henriciella sp.]
MRFGKWRSSGLAIMATVLAGCVSVLPAPEAPDALYQIDPVPVRQSLPKGLLVRLPEAPQIVSGQALAREDETGAIRLIPKVEWSEGATRLLQMALVESFGFDGKGTAVMSDSGLLADYELVTRLRVFNLRGEQAVCEADIMIAQVRTAQVLDRTSVEIARPVDSPRAVDRALAMKESAEACVSKISSFAADSLRRHTALLEAN